MSDQDEQELYDEFGNYIGPDLDSSSSEDDDDDDSEVGGPPDENSDVSGDEEEENNNNNDTGEAMMVVRGDTSDNDAEMADPASAIVLHEDKEHYPSAEQVYGDDVRTAVLDEDAVDLDTPLVEPVVSTSHVADDTIDAQDWIYSEDYLGVHIANETTRTRRGFAIVGHFHHGKTSLIDLLLEPTLQKTWGPRASLDVCAGGGPRYTDTLKSEQERQMSLQSTPLTVLLPDTRGKTYCLTAIDCPGHPNFHGESVAALRLADGAVVVVDIVEGIMMHTEQVVRQAVVEGLPICLVINKMDRCIVELKLPPRDCYFKILTLIQHMNALIKTASGGRYPELSPAAGNVAFSSSQHGWLFTLSSFASVYLDHADDEKGLGENLSVDDLAVRLWGDTYLDPNTRTFHKSARSCPSAVKSGITVERTFLTFILEPLYKIYAACLGEREPDVNKLLRSVGVLLSKEQLRASARPLLRAALAKFLQTAQPGFVDMVVKNFPCPAAAAKGKLARCYTGPLDIDDADDKNSIVKSMLACDSNGPAVVHCVKMYSSSDGKSFLTLGRVYAGTIRPAEKIRVLGEGYSEMDDEDAATCEVETVAIPRGRGRTVVSAAKAGNWVLLSGVDANIAKTATIVGLGDGTAASNGIQIFAPLKFLFAGGESVIRLAIEPLNPAELPKMVDGLRSVSKAYPMVKTKVEESGEHVLLGTGELFLDCVMHDLRHVYSNIEIKVADPIVSFRETVVESSILKCFAETTNKRNKVTMISEPLEEGLAEQLESGRVKISEWDNRKLGRFFQSKYDWDLLSSRSVWAFGDNALTGSNILMDDTLPSEVDKSLLGSCKSSIVQGFRWAVREGPLCEEPVRATKLKLLDAVLADKPIHRGGGQIIPAARKVVHSSLLTAKPRLMEPIYRLQIQCPGPIVENVGSILTRRRGHVVQDRPIPGTTLYTIKGFVPALDMSGLEVDLRTTTQGQAMIWSVFDHWWVVPGDPLDSSIVLHPLEPSPPNVLARELLVKTRRRKGLSEDVSVAKFFDEAMKANMLESSFQQGN